MAMGHCSLLYTQLAVSVLCDTPFLPLIFLLMSYLSQFSFHSLTTQVADFMQWLLLWKSEVDVSDYFLQFAAAGRQYFPVATSVQTSECIGSMKLVLLKPVCVKSPRSQSGYCHEEKYVSLAWLKPSIFHFIRVQIKCHILQVRCFNVHMKFLFSFSFISVISCKALLFLTMFTFLSFNCCFHHFCMCILHNMLEGWSTFSGLV